MLQERMDKGTVLSAFLTRARDELSGVERSTRMALDEATSAESRPENKYDTRSLEASYLAAGQGQRLLTLRRLVSFLEVVDNAPPREVVGLLSLVEVGGDPSAWYFLAPDGGGMRISVEDSDVLVITPESPAGLALVGLHVGDELQLGKSPVQREILAIL